MKEFFYSNEECHIYEEDLKLAKFWKDMKPAEVDQIWDSVKK
jgi:thymidylate synthase